MDHQLFSASTAAVLADSTAAAHAGTISGYVSGSTAESFASDRKSVDACAFRIGMMSRAFAAIPSACPVREVPGLSEPLDRLSETAERIFSEYFSVDAGEIWKAATETVPEISRAARTAAAHGTDR